jgi:hypothetical protein
MEEVSSSIGDDVGNVTVSEMEVQLHEGPCQTRGRGHRFLECCQNRTRGQLVLHSPGQYLSPKI